jgi:HD superfamily phosphohydrolase
MTNEQKITLVADNLFYPIEISLIEKEFLSTQLVGRLHNILQNSTAFLTYPSNRNSRFSHSLGCMNLTGQLIKYSVINAKKEHRQKFFDDVKKEVKIIQEEIKEKRWNDTTINTRKYSKMTEENYEVFDDPFYCSALPGVISEDENYYFILIFQAIRLVALLHDIGHPPFSHISEVALSEIANNLQKKENTEKLNKKETVFLDSFKKLTHLNDQLERPLHEVVGLSITEKLFDMLSDFKLVEEKELKKLIIFNLSLKILQNENPFFESLHGIIDGDLDTDRLDFIKRDLAASGLGSDNAKYGRLIASYQLIYDEYNDKTNYGERNLKFLPSVRALSTIEKVFQERLMLYKYVIYHHSVAKSDCLLKEIIINLANDQFESKLNQKRQNDELPMDVSGLWIVFDKTEVNFKKEIINNFIQWDDSWLISVLRKQFFIIDDKEEKDLSANEKKLKVQLEEILSNKKHYISLFKRVDSFMNLDQEFLSNIPAGYDWKNFIDICRKFNPNLPEEEKFIKPIIESLKKIEYYHDEFKTTEKNTVEGFARLNSLRESEGFFLSKMIGVFRKLDNDPFKTLDFFQITCNEFNKFFDLDDTIIMPRFLKPGINRNFEIIVDNGLKPIQTIQAVSRIVDEMNRSTLLFPPFYIYFYKNNFYEKNYDLLNMQKKFGELLWDNFVEWTENL